MSQMMDGSMIAMMGGADLLLLLQLLMLGLGAAALYKYLRGPA